MNNARKHTPPTTHFAFTKIFFGIATLLMILYLIIGQIVLPDERDAFNRNCQLFETQWYQILENGEKLPVEVPGKIPAEYGEVITLTTTLPDDITEGHNLCFRTIWQDVAIYINGELRQNYTTKDSRPFGLNSAFRYVFLELHEADAGQTMTYCFSSHSKYAGNMFTCYIGDRMGIWASIAQTTGLKTLVAIFLLLMGFSCIIVCGILKWVYHKTLPLNYLAWVIFLCALWVLSETEFRQLIFKNVSVLTSGTYWTLMLIPLPLMLYINEIQNGYYKKVYVLPMIYASLVLIIGTTLQVLDIVQFVTQLPFVHGGFIASILCVIGTITLDAFKKRLKDYLAVAIGVYGLLATAVIELSLYYVGTGLSIGTVLLIGLLFLLIMAIIKTGQDLFVSEQKKQQALLAREAQAKFLANMSHEIRTPINAVIGMNEMILRENSNETILEYSRNIQRASNMLLGLVNDILDFSKIESGQLELVEDSYNLVPLIQDEILLLNTRAVGKAISTQLNIDPKLPTKLYGDSLRIKQILTNLLSNAVKYTQEGTVTLKATFRWLNSSTVELSFSIIDTGVGIKQEDLSKLFDSFKRLELKKNYNIEGTGLGLNIAKQLVDLMKGQILVESEYGKGSTFTVNIPQRVMDKQPIGTLDLLPKKHVAESSTSEGLFTAPDATILVVDDNSMNLSVIKGLLKRTAVQLDLATSGRECLELTKHKTYDVILMDHMMPDLDGVQTLKMLRDDYSNMNQNTLVIALTANAIAGCREMYIEYGFNDYISKPIQADKLEELLLHYLPKNLVRLKKPSAPTPNTSNAPTEKLDMNLDFLFIDRDLGLSYCFGSEDLYQEILAAFCEQAKEYLPMLELQFANCNWEQYAIITHGIKGNALNIGASNFSKLSLQHELAGKNKNSAFIVAECSNYIAILRSLIEKVENMAK